MQVPTTYYMNRVVKLPPLEAADAFDGIRAELAMIRGGSDERWTLPCVAGRLDAVGSGLPEALRKDPTDPIRVVRGRLRTHRGWLRVPVELQLHPWSREATEIGLRPSRRLGPWDERMYLDVGHDVLDRIRIELGPAVAWARAVGRSAARTSPRVRSR